MNTCNHDKATLGHYLYRVEGGGAAEPEYVMRQFKVINVLPRHVDIEACFSKPGRLSVIKRLRRTSDVIRTHAYGSLDAFEISPQAARQVAWSNLERDRRTGMLIIETAKRELAQLEIDIPNPEPAAQEAAEAR